ncbi:hypothetical protein HN734_00695 [Candidatus Woesearchaeota archaeon]|jgi:hypothetical protein|nr:hypothetical protein [Candidatus Woesearchaeota archaeon]MBT6367622.1 hypothetical protein [Candidatus Woesearchaeota archaeon]MBT7762356.1 hypothetical protein [Candidatus Woesearchaeota archaeon]
MKITKTQRLILYSLGQFYSSLNQPLTEKPIKLRTSKIMFIELLISSGIITKQARALYKNLETLENKKLIEYDTKKIKFTEDGLTILHKIDSEVTKFVSIQEYFLNTTRMGKRKLQTVIKS